MNDIQRDIEWIDEALSAWQRIRAAPPTPPTFEFRGPDNKPMITIRHTGEVELAPGLEISEASRLFWQRLADAFPAWRAEVIAAALAKENSND